MTGLSLHTSLPFTPTRVASPEAARPALAAAEPAALTAAEEARIADSFPARPAVAQKLYGPGRQVQHVQPLGGRLDLSA